MIIICDCLQTCLWERKSHHILTFQILGGALPEAESRDLMPIGWAGLALPSQELLVSRS